MEPLLILTHISLILTFGVLCTIISSRLKISNVLLFVITGLFLGNLKYHGEKLISLPEIFLSSIGILALVMIVFDGVSKFKLKEFDSLSWKALRLSIIFLILCVILMTFATKLMFNIDSIFMAIIFSILIAATDPSSVIALFGDNENKIISLLKVESIVNTPIVVIFPFIVLDIREKLILGDVFVIETFIDQLSPFLLNIIVGIGTGIIAGIILMKIMKDSYSNKLSPLAIFVGALFTYVLAENLSGSGVLAVTSLGLVFGNTYIKKRVQLQEFSSILSITLQILVFVLVGLILNIPLTWEYIIKSISLFIIYLFVRYLSVEISFKELKFKEKIFMTLNVSKGIAVAVMTFSLSMLPIFQDGIVLDLVLTFLLYSLILASIVSSFSKKLLNLDKSKDLNQEK